MARRIIRETSYRNVTGKVGVSYQPEGNTKSGKKKFEEYKATLRLNRIGEQKSTSITFSVLKYGKDEALRNACHVRNIYEKYYLLGDHVSMWYEIDTFVRRCQFENFPHLKDKIE